MEENHETKEVRNFRMRSGYESVELSVRTLHQREKNKQDSVGSKSRKYTRR